MCEIFQIIIIIFITQKQQREQELRLIGKY